MAAWYGGAASWTGSGIPVRRSSRDDSRPDREGLKRGWFVHDASKLSRDLHLEADVAIVGTGAGGGVAAEILSMAGLRVVMIEEGPLQELERLSHARARSVSAPLSGIGRAQNQRQRHHDSARARGRWLDDRELDEQFSNAGENARALARPLRLARTTRPIRSRRGSSASNAVSTSLRGAFRPTKTTRCSNAARASSGFPPR